MQYEVVFDIGHAGFRCWWFLAPGLVLTVVGSAVVYFRDQLALRGPRFVRRAFPFAFLGFATVWTVTAFGFTYVEYLRLTRALTSGAANVVEGRVESFDPMPYTGHKDVSFVVAGKRFRYSDFEATSAFNKSKSHGGPIDEGVQVRVWYVGNRIVRLAVAR